VLPGYNNTLNVSRAALGAPYMARPREKPPVAFQQEQQLSVVQYRADIVPDILGKFTFFPHISFSLYWETQDRFPVHIYKVLSAGFALI
jgi:hypothetical protein